MLATAKEENPINANLEPVPNSYQEAPQFSGESAVELPGDNHGNQIQKTNNSTSAFTLYEYDAENKLIRVVREDGSIVNYKYDGLQRRIEKEVDSVVTQYIYDNEDILLELDGSNNITARYTHSSGIDEPLIMEKGGGSFFYHEDGLGSITELTDTIGTVVQSYTYSSFGKIESQSDPNFVQPYTFIARELDPETGFYYMRARYYDSITGRFIQEDLLPGRKSLPQSINMYPYVINNPVNFIDPDGESIFGTITAIAVGVGVYLAVQKFIDFIQEGQEVIKTKNRVSADDLDNFVPAQQQFQQEFAENAVKGGEGGMAVISAPKSGPDVVASLINFCIVTIGEFFLDKESGPVTPDANSTPD